MHPTLRKYKEHSLESTKEPKIVLTEDSYIDDAGLIVYNDRGIGKTTNLIFDSLRLNAPIIVGSDQTKRLVEDLALSLGVGNSHKKIEVHTAGETLRGKRFPDGILIDETISLTQLACLIEKNHFKIAGGFFQNKYFAK